MQRRTKKRTRKILAETARLERDAQLALVEMRVATGDIDRLIHHYK